jgi:hypothetical protein
LNFAVSSLCLLSYLHALNHQTSINCLDQRVFIYSFVIVLNQFDVVQVFYRLDSRNWNSSYPHLCFVPWELHRLVSR